jgi:hypothetical protein
MVAHIHRDHQNLHQCNSLCLVAGLYLVLTPKPCPLFPLLTINMIESLEFRGMDIGQQQTKYQP